MIDNLNLCTENQNLIPMGKNKTVSIKSLNTGVDSVHFTSAGPMCKKLNKLSHSEFTVPVIAGTSVGIGVKRLLDQITPELQLENTFSGLFVGSIVGICVYLRAVFKNKGIWNLLEKNEKLESQLDKLKKN